MNTSGLSAGDILAITRSNGYDNDAFGGMGGIWGVIMLLIIAGIFGGNGNWFGGNGNNGALQNALTRSDLFEGFNTQDINSQLRGITNGLCDGFFATNNALKDGFFGVQSGIGTLSTQMQNCCCETNRNIDNLRFTSERNTCDIITNQNAGVQRILDKMCENETQALRDRLFKAELANSQAQQNATLIDTLRPCPIPSYNTCNPWASNYGSCGCGNSLY